MVVLPKIGRKCAQLLAKSVIIVGKMVISAEQGPGNNPKSAGVMEKDGSKTEADLGSAGELAGLMHVMAGCVTKVAAK